LILHAHPVLRIAVSTVGECYVLNYCREADAAVDV